ncbi:MAG: hypothetical protein HQ546_11825, partial [Planctomycetes bacterium]|nr:hypothetical protein [Planctomycetota bacterium]
MTDRINAVIKSLIEKGTSKGYLTYEEMNEKLPEEFSPENLDGLLMTLDEKGIELLDEADVPGQKDYGPGGKWIHDRAHGLMDSMSDTYGAEEAERVAYATATQQAHKVGKSPKGFRTPEGVRTAKRKHNRPTEEYRKTAELLQQVKLTAFHDELMKIADAMS